MLAERRAHRLYPSRGLQTRLRHAALGARALFSAVDPRQRALLNEMRAYVRGLPGVLAQPLPQALASQTPVLADLQLPPDSVRQLADAAALLDRGSPLGLCLRRSFVRYFFLRRAGLPVTINFGARLIGGVADRDVAGHAWVTLDGRPYFEDGENCDGFVVMLRHPSV
jgi:hypothetical protein